MHGWRRISVKVKTLLWLLLGCASIYTLSIAIGYALVIYGVVWDGSPVANTLANIGFISFVTMPAAIMFFIVFSAQRAIYALHPPTFRKYIPYWRWLEADKDNDGAPR